VSGISAAAGPLPVHPRARSAANSEAGIRPPARSLRGMLGAASHPAPPTATPRAHASMRGCSVSAAKWSSPTLRALAADSGPNAGNGPGRARTCAAGQGDAVAYGSYVDEVVAYQQTVGGIVGRYYPHYNHLYSVAALTDSTGAVVERFTYDAYGRMTITSAGGVSRSKSAVGWDRGFTGYISDPETGLLHARARQYSPGLGRFIGRDNVNVNRIETKQMSEVDPESGRQWPVTSAKTGNLQEYYRDGLGLYSAYFVPNRLDPTGNGCEDNEWACLACMIYAEARGQSSPCRLAVLWVIRNRVNSPDFPNTICEVNKQRGQFSGYNNANYKKCMDQCNTCPGKYPDGELGESWDTAGQWPPVGDGVDPTGGALWYNNAGMNSWASRNRTKVNVPSCAVFDFYK
jgi:RHS repeat-associated protein